MYLSAVMELFVCLAGVDLFVVVLDHTLGQRGPCGENTQSHLEGLCGPDFRTLPPFSFNHTAHSMVIEQPMW
jgi:hypothetical protein